MRLPLVLGVALAIGLHAAFLLFGGLLMPKAKEDHGTLQEVDLLTSEETQAEKQPEEAEKQPQVTEAEELETDVEAPPDAEEVVRTIELSAAVQAPALEAASLSAIEQALSGAGAGAGDFAESLTFASGGRIGGTGKAGALGEAAAQDAFSLTEIDQRPRAVFQSSPAYPSELRGKKIEGSVTIIFVVDPSGKVTGARVEKSTHPAFEKPALDAIRQWKFEPAVKGGQRVPCKTRQSIRFQPS